MQKKDGISAERLRSGLKPAHIPYASSAEIPLGNGIVPPQPRALAALELALNISDPGYNVYLSGDNNLGRSYMLKRFLQPRAKKAVTPPDLVYVHNFDKPDAPLLFKLTAGQGARFKAAMNKAIDRIRKELPAFMERDSYIKRRNSLQVDLQDGRNRIIKRMDKVAGGKGFKLDLDENGAMTLYPLVDGKRLNEQDFDNLEAAERDNIKLKGDSLAQSLHVFLRKLGRMEQDFLEGERNLEKEVAAEFVGDVLDPLAERYRADAAAPEAEGLPAEYFAKVREDILENLDYFLPPYVMQQDGPQPPAAGGAGGGAGPFQASGSAYGPAHGPSYGVPHGYDGAGSPDIFYRYDVNLFVDNGGQQGAPVIFEDHPTVHNLLGCIEREAELGALVTNFTLAKAGSLHKANGGFLVMPVEDLLQHPLAWEGLMRSLRSGQARLDDSGDGDGAKTKGIKPAPLDLSVKVILIGDDYVYDSLYQGDIRFSKFFSIKAQMSRRTPRNAAGVKVYLKHIRRIIEDAKLLHFDREALAALIDCGSLLLEDQKYLSLEIPLLRQIMLEASAMARMEGCELVGAELLRKAMLARDFRANLVEDAFMDEYDRNLIKVKTSGQAIGVVNGLSVSNYGDFEFGLPHQISCAVGVGHDGIIDLEREAELGGPIHTKAIMILKSYLVSQFARKKPLYLTGSICFEQSYAGVEGDSASGAELAVLLSAIAQVPIDLSLAFTGALSQSGQIMAVGGVIAKVEGFFKVCQRHGLTGNQGVILPRDNLEHLILRPALLQAIEDKQFHIYPVEHISEAMELLTGLPCGRLRKDGSFTPGSLFSKVDRRLAELTKYAVKSGKS
ncbi:MAG: AAA family ATPase [Deltaproteobacteria bacterium]|jgi:predicted ATP-dependent protease|nr:AAA family ATPase [Deltaproteobacteria bacterium]